MTGSRLLDRYLLIQWLKLFTVTTLGFPLVSIAINLTDQLSRLIDNGLTARQIAVSYLYGIPENMFLIMPAAVLFATVFTVGNLGRHSELTAAKAGGISFYRLIRPLIIVSALAGLLAYAVGELAVGSTARMNRIQKKQEDVVAAGRYNFVYRADGGWVYIIQSLNLAARRLEQVVFERQGSGLDYPALIVSADSATYDRATRGWKLWHGTSRIVADAAHEATFEFSTMRLRAVTEAPADLLVQPKSPDEMRYAELGRYIESLRRSGNDVAKLRVEQALKIALPVACLVIALFAAPMAVTTQRAGPAAGVAISLGTTVLFLMMTQIAQAVGNGGAVNPVLAAWFPDLVFTLFALVLLARVRT